MFGLKKPRDGRANPRWHIDRFLAVYDQDKSTFLGRVMDLSVSGMSVLSSEVLPIGNHVRLAIEVLQEDGSVRTCQLRCRCQWSQPDGDDGLHRMGLEFSGSSPAIIQEIERLIREQDLARAGSLRPRVPR
jgi:c-di-GMP-binding flagellar brake protein YcgR